jgi:hypothetical protein
MTKGFGKEPNRVGTSYMVEEEEEEKEASIKVRV